MLHFIKVLSFLMLYVLSTVAFSADTHIDNYQEYQHSLKDVIIDWLGDSYVKSVVADYKNNVAIYDSYRMKFSVERYGSAKFGERSLYISMHPNARCRNLGHSYYVLNRGSNIYEETKRECV
jgi:hypothetical protein